MLFADANAARDFAARLALTNALGAPFVSAKVSTLGGEKNVAVMLCVSLDDQETWQNNILENSRYFRMSINNDGAIEQLTLAGIKQKFRKSRVKTLDDAFAKIANYVMLLNVGQVKPEDCDM